jgi:hypothetical protein
MCAHRIRQAPPPVRGSVRTGRTSTALSAATVNSHSATRCHALAHRVWPIAFRRDSRSQPTSSVSMPT